MNGMFLSVAVDNANFMIPRGLVALSRGPLARHQDIHQICTAFRQRGVASLFLEGVADAYWVNAMQSASVFIMELRRTADAAKVTSFARPLFDAASAGYWEAALEIARLSRTTWNRDYEYEDDFLYVRSWIQALLGEGARAVEATLRRWEEVLEGAADVRLDICRALLGRDDEAFDSGLRALLAKRQVDVNDMVARKAMADDAAVWMQHFALEGVALLQLAERMGLHPGQRYLHCPDALRAKSPFVFDPNAWMRADYVPRRYPTPSR
jgi:Immunity protein 49